ncbi:prepilin-type N-terminal cleavage/methylation domain-containing protein [Budviciaceae bacterium BWR-B9]|uniref:Prepilin-type N-terminal cleavage/methylation domain-containing protein n=1 Tax=Limnobaculum allomyrinae TaxID=2791986 RepID=A0ABS1IS70_9GAMM|nr:MULTISPECIES: prepilin-type N-terminal cleavage/methylation domain-containing protein [Limnobaculum]MBK5144605.1 prepilin-type N-terminal cleavage/methylation domain-containing protein [Limnobaculum allomyrinae]MBV7692164.1 prepilin-type N-terminal cleavage/methylation domain-containing protein [Limnobaculum sp. M2-1]
MLPLNMPRQGGFSLLEVLISMLLFSITIMGLLRYQQVLLAQFNLYTDNQYAWRLAAQALEIYPELIEQESKLKSGQWHLNVVTTSMGNGCQKMTAQVIMSGKQSVELEKWQCNEPVNP